MESRENPPNNLQLKGEKSEEEMKGTSLKSLHNGTILTLQVIRVCGKCHTI